MCRDKGRRSCPGLQRGGLRGKATGPVARHCSSSSSCRKVGAAKSRSTGKCEGRTTDLSRGSKDL
eukprot:4892969-Pyramimonas_sp.AAC.1